jgi:hypothetical protein
MSRASGTRCENVQLRCQRPELRSVRDGFFQAQQRLSGGRIVEHRSGDEVGEDPDAVHVVNTQPGRPEQCHELGFREPTREGVVITEPSVGIVECVHRFVEATGQCPAGDRRGDSGRKDAGPTTGAQYAGNRSESGGRVIDVLEDAVAEHDIDARSGDGAREAADVALDGTHLPGETGLGRPALEGGQRVGAGIDDGDAMPEGSQGYGELAGATPCVDDVEGVDTACLRKRDHRVA